MAEKKRKERKKKRNIPSFLSMALSPWSCVDSNMASLGADTRQQNFGLFYCLRIWMSPRHCASEGEQQQSHTGRRKGCYASHMKS